MGLLQEISSDEKKPSRLTTSPLIEPPGKPHGVVAAVVTEAEVVPVVESEIISCRHLRTKKVLLIGTDPMGNLDWSDVEIVNQCLQCTCILRDNGP